MQKKRRERKDKERWLAVWGVLTRHWLIMMMNVVYCDRQTDRQTVYGCLSVCLCVCVCVCVRVVERMLAACLLWRNFARLVGWLAGVR